MINKSSLRYVLGFTAVMCLTFGTAIAVVHYLTVDTMKKNDALLQNRKLAAAFLVPVAGVSSGAYEQALKKNIRSATISFRNHDWQLYAKPAMADSAAIGFVFSGVGFWDVIRGILVLTPDLSHIVTIEFLTQSETPGLGARIEEQWFKDQFKGLTINWNDSADKRIIIGSSPDPGARNRVDAITGATQTSLALMQLLNRELEQFRELYRVKKDTIDSLAGWSGE